MIKNNYLKNKFEKNMKCLGTWSVIPSVINTDIIGKSNFDFVILDQEHGPINFETMQNQIISSENNQMSPIVRVPKVNIEDILRSLDIGAHGIQVPNIEDIDDIYKIIEFAKYPPVGNRGFSTFTRAGGYNLKNKEDLYKNANQNTLIGINIESKKGLKMLDKIADIKEVDMIFFGTFDLSKEIGIPGDTNHKDLDKIILEATKFLHGKKKVTGTIATNKESLNKYISYGMQYILYKVDCGIISDAFDKIRSSFDEINK